MYKKEFISKVVEGIYAEYVKSLEKLVDVKMSTGVLDSIKSKSCDEAILEVSKYSADVVAVLKGSSYDDFSVNAFRHRVKGFAGTDDKLAFVEVVVGTKIGRVPSASYNARITVSDNLLTDIANFYRDAFIQLLYLEFASSNIEELNSHIAVALEESGAPYTVDFAIGTNYIVEASDTGVTFGLDVASAVEMSNAVKYREVVPASAPVIEEAPAEESAEPKPLTDEEIKSMFADFDSDNTVPVETQIAEAVANAPTVPLFIHTKIDFLKKLTGVAMGGRKVSSLIKKSVHRSADQIRKGKAYVLKTVKINKEEVKIFAIVEQDDKGDIKTVLSPFDTETNYTVDYDVVADLKK